MMDIIYEPHPVTPERKAELRAQGLKIIDARFKPADEQAPGRVPLTEEISGMKRAEVIEWLKAHGVDDPKGKVEDLRARLTRILYVDL